MSVNARINVAFKRRLPKDVEYAAVCGFGSPKRFLKKLWPEDKKCVALRCLCGWSEIKMN